MSYNLVEFLNNSSNKTKIINQFETAYNNAFAGRHSITELLGFWYITANVTTNSNTSIINFIYWVHNTSGYYTQSEVEYDIKGGVDTNGGFTANAINGPQAGTGASATTSGLSNSELSVLTQFYPFSPISPIPISNVCFVSGTPIVTDQGEISIEQINPCIHTISNKKIVAISKTTSIYDYLVSFEKDALGLNIPTQKTTMSKNHKILYNGKMIEADKFVSDIFQTVKRVKYTGEILYNVLMEKYDTINVNNLICESLHPDNYLSKLYTSTELNETYKNIFIILMNKCIIEKDYCSFKLLSNAI